MKFQIKFNSSVTVVFLLLILSSCVSQKKIKDEEKKNEENRIALQKIIDGLEKKAGNSNQPHETNRPIQEELDRIKKSLESVYKEIDKETGKKTKTRLNNLRLKTEALSNAAQELKVVQIAIEKVVSEKLESDLSFDVGKSVLKESGKKEIDDMVENVKAQIMFWNNFPKDEQPKKFADKSKKVAISITGYADLQGSINDEKRKKYNLELSNDRANAVKAYFELKLSDITKNEKIDLKIKAVGKGEELPIGVKNVTKIDNPERRICVITLGVIPTL